MVLFIMSVGRWILRFESVDDILKYRPFNTESNLNRYFSMELLSIMLYKVVKMSEKLVTIQMKATELEAFM